jgi:hypothetical protein
MSFEEAVRTAGIVIHGTVTESEEYGTVRQHPGGTTVVVRKHRVHADEYLKGDGAPDIVVETLGGKYMREVDGKQTEHYLLAGGQPQLPAVGTEVVLFLTPFGGKDTFMISSATAGVVSVDKDANGQAFVKLGFEDPDVMPLEAREAYKQANPRPNDQFFGAAVPLKDLGGLVQRAGDPKPKPTEAKAKPSP